MHAQGNTREYSHSVTVRIHYAARDICVGAILKLVQVSVPILGDATAPNAFIYCLAHMILVSGCLTGSDPNILRWMRILIAGVREGWRWKVNRLEGIRIT